MIVIFDWDGTLCDSIEHIVKAMQHAAAELQLPALAVAEIRDIVGLGLPQAVKVLYPEEDDTTRAELAAAYSRHYIAVNQDPAQLFDGALDTLLALRDRGFELAVATGKSRRGLNRVLEAIDLKDFFEITRCADETRSKPHPQMLEEIMACRNKAPTEVVVVGDTEYDLAMARNAGVRSVGVSFGVHSNERLARFEPVAIVDSLPHLLDLDALAG
jgi:phosphoglycolate phosphatase